MAKITNSIADAISEGIQYETRTGRRNTKYTVFFVPCDNCKEIFEKKSTYNRNETYLCYKCKCLNKARIKTEKKNELLKTKSKEEIRFDKAAEAVLIQAKDKGKYKNPIEIAKTKCTCYGSIPEAMVAIELIKLGYQIIPQQKISKYKVDFAIPKEKYIIEVDGSIYHRKVNNEREAIISLSIGPEWKIIHVPADISKKIYKLQDYISKYIEEYN